MIEQIQRLGRRIRDEFSARTEFSAASLGVLAVLLLAVVTLSNQLLRGARLDLTENRLYTLSDGSRALLKKIDEPINLYFFYTPEAVRDIPTVSNYARRVREMLEEMTEAAGGKLKLTVIGPEPFSADEDRAVELGVQSIPVNDAGDKLYFGLAGRNAVGESEAIPFFQPDREGLLEYDLAKLIYQLNQARKPVVGLLSSLNLEGGFDVRTMQPQPAWTAIEQLRSFFEVRKLDQGSDRIPQEIELLLLVHPADLSPATRYAIDQFVLAGGKALVFVDPFAEAAQEGAAGGPPVAPHSDLKELFAAWGLRLQGNQVLADGRYALQVSFSPAQPAFYHLALLSVPGSNLNQDDVITRGLESLNLAYAGILEPVANAKTRFIPLVHSSSQAMPLPAAQVQTMLTNPAALQTAFKPTGKSYVLAARITGPADSAFANGPPPAPAQDQAKAPGQEAGSQAQAPPAHLSQAKDSINVVVVADTDLLRDQMWVRVQNLLGQRLVVPLADNGNFLIHAVDNLLGSTDLIGIHSRAGYARPFDRVEALRRQAESRFRAKEEELQGRLRETERKLNELQTRKDEASALILSPEQKEALLRFQQEELKIRKELREVRHQLDKDIDRLGAVVKFINIILVPLLLIAAVVGVGWWRRRGPRLAGGPV